MPSVLSLPFVAPNAALAAVVPVSAVYLLLLLLLSCASFRRDDEINVVVLLLLNIGRIALPALIEVKWEVKWLLAKTLNLTNSGRRVASEDAVMAMPHSTILHIAKSVKL